jgi:hypothetical protein
MKLIKTEADIRRQLKDVASYYELMFGNKIVFSRNESGDGKPDIYYYTECSLKPFLIDRHTSGWLELKVTEQLVNGDIPIRYEAGQRKFLLKHSEAHGKTFVLLYITNIKYYFLLNKGFKDRYESIPELMADSKFAQERIETNGHFIHSL